jgi:hypothetical protein
MTEENDNDHAVEAVEVNTIIRCYEQGKQPLVNRRRAKHALDALGLARPCGPSRI